MGPLGELIARGDLDALVREADALASRGDWDGLLALRDACERAVETGRQLWGPARYAEYRVALDAPGPVAAAVVRPGSGRFTLGPLTEVVSQHHTWDELADHLEPRVVAATVAQERILRGEDLTGDDRAATDELDLPSALQPWEPAYPLPVYRPSEVLAGGPEVPATPGEPSDAPPGRPVDLPDVAHALRAVVAPWAEQSTGEVAVATVAGDVHAAVGALTTGPAEVWHIGPTEAFAWLAWAAASGGAHGRRRGSAAGRAAAFTVGGAVTGLPAGVGPDELEFHLEELEWARFGSGGDGPGWQLRLAVADPREGWAAAVDATDVAPDGPRDRRSGGPAGCASDPGG